AVRDRDRTPALQGVSRRPADVLLRRRDRAPLLPGQRREDGGPQRGRPGVLRRAPPRRVGVGHVPPRPVRLRRPRGDVQGRQRGGAGRQGDLVAPPVDRRRLDLGARGEELAAAWYAERGYTVLARNWRCREGELDLVLARGRCVVFC